MYIHLTTHSTYSPHEGSVTPAEPVQVAHAGRMLALGLTDQWLLTDVVEFVTACKENGIQPVIGLQVDLQDGLVSLLATSVEGWSNLCRLSSALALRDDLKDHCSMELLASHSGDLIPLTCQSSELKEIFHNRLYVALRDPNQSGSLSNLAHKLTLPTVVAHPVYCFGPNQAVLQRALAAICLNSIHQDDTPAEPTLMVQRILA